MQSVDQIDVSRFAVDEGLCAGETIVVVIKNFERLEIIQRVKSRRQGSKVGPSRPRDGAIAAIRLTSSSINDDALQTGMLATCRSPYEYVQDADGIAFFNSYDSLHRVSPDGSISFSNQLMRRLHSVSMDEVQNLVLVSSSGFDTLHFFDKELNSKGEISLWEIYPKIARFEGITFHLGQGSEQKRSNGTSGALRKIRPEEVPDGLGVQQSPFYLSGASIASDGNILFTGYNSTSIFVLSNGSVREVDLGLRSPHCFREIKAPGEQRFYMVVDSGHGRLLYLRNDLTTLKVLAFSALDRPFGSDEGGDWLQYAEYQNSGDLLLVADQSRSCIHILDVPGERRRSITYPRTWSLHGVHLVGAANLRLLGL